MDKEIYGKIYKITNLINNKVYIGKTIQGFRNRYKINKDTPLNYGYYLYQKWYGEKENDRHCNKHILNSMEKYGWENFTIEESMDIVYKHKYSKEELDSRERYWIYCYKSNNKRFGYNKTEGGDGGGRITAQCYKVVLLNNKKEFPSLVLASEYIGIKDYDSICSCCKGLQKYAGKHEGEFAVWRFYDDYLNMTEEDIKKALKSSNDTRKNKKIKRKVLCINDNKEFSSLRRCGEYYKVNHGRISECCKGDREYILIDNDKYYFCYIEE